MKRFISLFLTFVILSMSINTVVFAGEVTNLTLNGTDVINTTLGDGYYDSKCNESRTSSFNVECNSNICSNCPENGTRYHYPFTHGNVSVGTTVILNPGDWAKYNISSLDEGAYEVSISYGSKEVKNKVLTITFETNDGSVVSNTLPATGAYTTYTDGVIGTLQLSGNQETVKMLATNVAAYVQTITFTKIAPPSVSSWSSNADVSDGVVARGADLFTITMSEAVKPETVTADTVKILAGVEALSADVSAEGETITLKLKESLEFGADYTLFVDKSVASEATNIAMDDDYEDAFSAADDSNQAGSATIEVLSYEAGNGTITASGYVKSSAGLGIKGREVRIFGQNKENSDATFETSVLSETDGAFEILYSIDENAKAGDYDVEITSDYVEAPYSALLPYQGSFSDSVFKTKTTEIYGKDVLEGGHETGYFDTSGNAALEQSGNNAVVLRQSEWTAYDISAFKTGYYEISLALTASEDSEVTVIIGGKTYGVIVPKSIGSSFKTTIIARDLVKLCDTIKVLNESDSVITLEKIKFERTVSHDTKIETDDVIPGGQNVGYFDSGEDGMLEGSTSICIRTTEWTAYDISSLSAGTYIVSMKRGCMGYVFVNLYADSRVVTKNVFSTTGDYTTYKETCLGVIYLKEGDQVLRLENAGTTAFYADYLTLSKISDEEILGPEFALRGKDVYSTVEGEGYHDEAGLDFSNSKVSNGNSAILDSKDWMAYDISGVEDDGAYDLVACVGTGNGTTLDFKIDGKTIHSASIESTTADTTYAEVSIGKVFLNKSQKLTIENTGAGKTYLQYFKLTKAIDGSEFNVTIIKPTEVISGGDGVGYYDNQSLAHTSGGNIEVTSSGIVTLRKAEWLKYDVSWKSPGEYLLYGKMSNTGDATLGVGLGNAYVDSTSLDVEAEASDNIIDFYDNSGADEIETSDGLLALRQGGEWASYDISSLLNGTYSLSVTWKNAYGKTSNNAGLDFIIDDDLELRAYTAKASTDLETDKFVGNIYIPNGAKTLKIKNHGYAAVYLDSFSLERIGEEDTSDNIKISTQNATSDNNAAGNFSTFVLLEDYYDSRCKKRTETVNPETGEKETKNAAYTESCNGSELCVNYTEETGDHLPFTNGNINNYDYTIFHVGSWARYDVSSLRKGTYRVTLNASARENAIVALKFGGIENDASLTKELTVNALAGVSGSDLCATFDDNVLGKITISETDEFLYIESAGDAAFASTWMTLEYVSGSGLEELNNYVSVKVNATGDYSNYNKVLLGKFVITEDTKVLKIENLSTQAVMIQNFELEVIPFKNNLKITVDPEGEVEAIRFHEHDILYLTGSFENTYYAPDEIKIFIAYYDAEGRLLDFSTNYIETEMNTTTNVSIPIEVNHDALKLKVLLWKNIDGFEPVMTEKTIYVGWDSHYYVDAENGKDSNSGESEEKALKTLSAAQAIVREKNDSMIGDIYVHLSGEFEIDETMEMTPEDSGTNGFSVIYSGDGNASISGGEKISGFVKVEGTPLYKTTVSDTNFRQLYVNGNRAQRARSKWLYQAKEAFYPETEDIPSTDGSDEDEEIINPIGYILDGNDFPEDFSMVSDMEMIWMPSWRNVRVPVESMERLDNGDLKVEYPDRPFDAIFTSSAAVEDGDYFYIENAPEFLDEPGEWYCNNEGELFYYPLETDDMETADVFIPRVEKLLSMSGNDDDRIENITIKGIEFKYGAWNRVTEAGISPIQAETVRDIDSYNELTKTYQSMMIPAQISVDYGKNINFLDNKVVHMGSVGISFDDRTVESKIEGNLFDDTSAAAITVSRGTLLKIFSLDELCGYIDIKNNLIRRASVEYMTPAMTVYYAHHTNILNNDIKDCPYTGISLGWGWNPKVSNCTNNIVANNRIENVLYKTRDGGHIYTLSRGDDCVIENNYMIKSGDWKGGIYLDSGSSNFVIRNNVFEGVNKWVKLTFTNLSGNTTYDNYCETEHGVVPDRLVDNNITEAIGKTNGEWSATAKNIIANAGLSSDYKHLITEYEQNTHYRNAEIARMPYIAKPGISFPAGQLIGGGEGVAYHDLTETENNTKKGANRSYSYDGSGHILIQSTKQGEWTKHPIEIPEDGTYKLYVNGSSRYDGIKSSIWLNDVKIVDRGEIANTGDYSTYADHYMGTFDIKAGSYVLKFEHTVMNLIVNSFRFVKVEDDSKPFDRNDGFDESIYSAIIN